MFNPISLYYCFDPGGEEVRALVAEVSNTPWGERHAYAFDGLRSRVAKRFHVSPFLGMEADYALRATMPGERLQVHVEQHHAAGAASSTLRCPSSAASSRPRRSSATRSSRCG